MFFIVPTLPKVTTPPLERPAKVPKLSSPEDIDSSGYYRRRVSTACDRCRLKKARCSNGQTPCQKCKRDGVICVVSKDRMIDTTPKAPGYVKMVESQRDFLLRTVVELQQKSNPQIGASPDVNQVLQELNIRVGDSDDVSCSLLQDSSLFQTRPGAITMPDNNLDAPRLDFTGLEEFPWVDMTSMGTSSTKTTTANAEVNFKDHILGETTGRREPGSKYPQEELFDSYQLDDNILRTRWASANDDPYLGYDANLAVSTLTDKDELQQQLRQNGDMEFLDKYIMQDAL